MKACEGEMVWFGSRSPSLFIDSLFGSLGGGECENTLAFRIRSTRGKWPLLGMEAKERNIYQKPEKKPPCNDEDKLRTGLVVIEAWFGGY